MDKIFVNGLISKEVEATAPDFIMGKLSVSVEDLIKWLEVEGRNNATNGWLNLTIKKSKLGKRYIELDTWKPTPKTEVVETKEDTNIPDVEGEGIDLNEIPF